MEYEGEWNGWDDGLLLKDDLFIEKCNQPQPHDERKTKKLAVMFPPQAWKSPLAAHGACWTQNSLLFSCLPGMATHGSPWGVNIYSNKGQMLGQNDLNSCKTHQTTILNHKSRIGV